ncbi:TBCD [Mytilus edulis]|uniref:TBCD n=1 Tax=Mytilus edulis TaxID=6550 RepID=A0A8S3QP85_MYTED|nr:TBCD [Mytilus edulis]
MTRPDVQREKLPDFLDWSLQMLHTANTSFKDLSCYVCQQHTSNGVCQQHTSYGVCQQHTSYGVCQQHTSYGVCQQHTSYGVCQQHTSYGVCQQHTSYGVCQQHTSYGVCQQHTSYGVCQQHTSYVNCASGTLRVLSLLFKHGKREDLLKYAPVVKKKVEELKKKETNDTLLRKSVIKVIQRLGLTFLKNRVAAWRYQRGSRSLADNLSTTFDKNNSQQFVGVAKDDEDEEYDIPDEIEDNIYLEAYVIKDTIVRWSAAKGIGRITGRLPKELADEVVGSVLELFTIQESDGAWHGGCLSLAELGRRGLLLPQRLPDVVPVVLKALDYDEKRGNFSVGAHVRDSACYVCWAFARAYDPQEIAPYVNDVANALVKASIFDREVNVRRASSAAFQENVGRQGTFPHGIDILTMADYFAVGNRNHCYLELSIFVAKFPEYTKSMIDHLVDMKINHWDGIIRDLSAQGLHKLTSCSPDYMASQVLPKMLPMTTGIDLYLRHGAILAVAEITHALSKVSTAKGKKIEDVISKDVINGLKNIAVKLTEAKMFRGYGGDFMRRSVSCLIEKLSLSKLPYYDDPVLDLWQTILDECLGSIDPDNINQTAAASAIPAFFTEYYKDKNGGVNAKKQETVIEKYLHELRAQWKQQEWDSLRQ